MIQYRQIIAIFYKCNVQKVLFFIDTKYAGITKAGIPYLLNLPESCSNVSIYPFTCPLVMYKLFGSVNEIDSDNKLRQYYLALVNYWINQCDWIQLYRTVDIIINIKMFWKLFSCVVKRDHYDKFIGIR